MYEAVIEQLLQELKLSSPREIRQVTEVLVRRINEDTLSFYTSNVGVDDPVSALSQDEVGYEQAFKKINGNMGRVLSSLDTITLNYRILLKYQNHLLQKPVEYFSDAYADPLKRREAHFQARLYRLLLNKLGLLTLEEKYFHKIFNLAIERKDLVFLDAFLEDIMPGESGIAFDKKENYKVQFKEAWQEEFDRVIAAKEFNNAVALFLTICPDNKEVSKYDFTQDDIDKFRNQMVRHYLIDLFSDPDKKDQAAELLRKLATGTGNSSQVIIENPKNRYGQDILRKSIDGDKPKITFEIAAIAINSEVTTALFKFSTLEGLDKEVVHNARDYYLKYAGLAGVERDLCDCIQRKDDKNVNVLLRRYTEFVNGDTSEGRTALGLKVNIFSKILKREPNSSEVVTQTETDPEKDFYDCIKANDVDGARVLIKGYRERVPESDISLRPKIEILEKIFNLEVKTQPGSVKHTDPQVITRTSCTFQQLEANLRAVAGLLPTEAQLPIALPNGTEPSVALPVATSPTDELTFEEADGLFARNPEWIQSFLTLLSTDKFINEKIQIQANNRVHIDTRLYDGIALHINTNGDLKDLLLKNKFLLFLYSNKSITEFENLFDDSEKLEKEIDTIFSFPAVEDDNSYLHAYEQGTLKQRHDLMISKMHTCFFDRNGKMRQEIFDAFNCHKNNDDQVVREDRLGKDVSEQPSEYSKRSVSIFNATAFLLSGAIGTCFRKTYAGNMSNEQKERYIEAGSEFFGISDITEMSNEDFPKVSYYVLITILGNKDHTFYIGKLLDRLFQATKEKVPYGNNNLSTELVENYYQSIKNFILSQNLLLEQLRAGYEYAKGTKIFIDPASKNFNIEIVKVIFSRMCALHKIKIQKVLVQEINTILSSPDHKLSDPYIGAFGRLFEFSKMLEDVEYNQLQDFILLTCADQNKLFEKDLLTTLRTLSEGIEIPGVGRQVFSTALQNEFIGIISHPKKLNSIPDSDLNKVCKLKLYRGFTDPKNLELILSNTQLTKYLENIIRRVHDKGVLYKLDENIKVKQFFKLHLIDALKRTPKNQNLILLLSKTLLDFGFQVDQFKNGDEFLFNTVVLEQAKRWVEEETDEALLKASDLIDPLMLNEAKRNNVGIFYANLVIDGELQAVPVAEYFIKTHETAHITGVADEITDRIEEKEKEIQRYINQNTSGLDTNKTAALLQNIDRAFPAKKNLKYSRAQDSILLKVLFAQTNSQGSKTRKARMILRALNYGIDIQTGRGIIVSTYETRFFSPKLLREFLNGIRHPQEISLIQSETSWLRDVFLDPEIVKTILKDPKLWDSLKILFRKVYGENSKQALSEFLAQQLDKFWLSSSKKDWYWISILTQEFISTDARILVAEIQLVFKKILQWQIDEWIKEGTTESVQRLVDILQAPVIEKDKSSWGVTFQRKSSRGKSGMVPVTVYYAQDSVSYAELRLSQQLELALSSKSKDWKRISILSQTVLSHTILNQTITSKSSPTDNTQSVFNKMIKLQIDEWMREGTNESIQKVQSILSEPVVEGTKDLRHFTFSRIIGRESVEVKACYTNESVNYAKDRLMEFALFEDNEMAQKGFSSDDFNDAFFKRMVRDIVNNPVKSRLRELSNLFFRLTKVLTVGSINIPSQLLKDTVVEMVASWLPNVESTSTEVPQLLDQETLNKCELLLLTLRNIPNQGDSLVQRFFAAYLDRLLMAPIDMSAIEDRKQELSRYASNNGSIIVDKQTWAIDPKVLDDKLNINYLRMLQGANRLNPLGIWLLADGIVEKAKDDSLNEEDSAELYAEAERLYRSIFGDMSRTSKDLKTVLEAKLSSLSRRVSPSVSSLSSSHLSSRSGSEPTTPRGARSSGAETPNESPDRPLVILLSEVGSPVPGPSFSSVNSSPRRDLLNAAMMDVQFALDQYAGSEISKFNQIKAYYLKMPDATVRHHLPNTFKSDFMKSSLTPSEKIEFAKFLAGEYLDPKKNPPQGSGFSLFSAPRASQPTEIARRYQEAQQIYMDLLKALGEQKEANEVNWLLAELYQKKSVDLRDNNNHFFNEAIKYAKKYFKEEFLAGKCPSESFGTFVGWCQLKKLDLSQDREVNGWQQTISRREAEKYSSSNSPTPTKEQ